ncbi:MAG: carboxypeptidase regulatory-like domain-containing protein [Acidobacteria bacterium]|nr:carboxypeptidase regulatory-like domain-containing protein [Acidobacteriota bacterium]
MAFLVLCVAGLTLPLEAQTFYGSIIGAVTDATGGAVPQAGVTLTNLGTGERRNMQTDGFGNYQFVNLVPAQYKIEVEKTGFRRFVREPIVVDVQSAVRIDVGMQVGEVNQVVEVTAATPLLQTESATLGQVVDGRKVLEAPLNGRNIYVLLAFVPGVVPGGQSTSNPTGTNPFAWGNYQIGGGQSNEHVTYIDGAPVNVSYINLTSLVPTQDAIAEFRVQTNSMGPEVGRLAGGAVNLTTRSGTNSFHGTAYEFLRNKVLNANTFFNNKAGVARPAFTQNQYGFNVGGPVQKDKTFFFFGYEGFKLRQGASYVYTVPTEAQRGGDFSDVRNAAGNVIPIYDPLTTCGRLGNAACGTNASGGEVISRTQFPGNIIPANRLDSAAKVMTNLWGRSNSSGNPFTHVNNYTANASVGGENYQYNARVDRSISEKQRIFFRYTYWNNLNLAIDPYRTKTCVDRCVEKFNTNQAVIGDTYSFTPNTIGDFRIAFLRFSYDRIPLTAGYDLTQLGWPASLNNQVAFRVQPIPIVTGYSGVFSTSGTGSTIVDRNDSYSLMPSLTKIAGKHTVKFGAEIRRLTHNYYQQNNPSGVFNFDSNFTTLNPLAPSGGDGFASFLLGYGAGGGITMNNFVAGQQVYRAYYGGDQFQITPRLTFNYGLRFEQMGPWSERFDRMVVLIPNAENPLSGSTGLPLKGKLGLVNSPDRTSRNNTDLHNLFAPRLGLAFRLNNKTVIRAGYGIFWIPNDVTFSISPNNDPVNSFTNPFVGTLDSSITPFNRLSNPFPNGIVPAPGHNPNGLSLFYGQGISAPLPHEPAAYAQQWNFGIQRELPGGLAVDLAYAGSKGTHLPAYSQQIDQLPNQFLQMGSALVQQVPNPFFGLIQIGALAQPTVQRGQLLRPFPEYNGMSINSPMNRNAIYHSGQMKVEKRFRHAGSLLGAYTWAKLISDTDTLTAWLEPNGNPGVQDTYNVRLERSLANYDVAHRLVVSYAVDLPFGKDQPLLSGVTGAVGKIVSGWGISGYTVFASGTPLPLTNAVNLTNSFGGGSRPISAGRSAKLEGAAQSRLNRWFDTSAFTAPPAFTFGNLARNLPDARSAGVNGSEFSVIKNTPLIKERVGLQFRTEIFNLFNRVRFNSPGLSLGTPQFGVVSGQYNEPRLVQFALRLLF